MLDGDRRSAAISDPDTLLHLFKILVDTLYHALEISVVHRNPGAERRAYCLSFTTRNRSRIVSSLGRYSKPSILLALEPSNTVCLSFCFFWNSASLFGLVAAGKNSSAMTATSLPCSGAAATMKRSPPAASVLSAETVAAATSRTSTVDQNSKSSP